jgi:predicted enzyme related to lactoylglutathione lyase
MRRRKEVIMPKIIGLGGVFFKSANPEALRDWYGRVLGLVFEAWGGVIFTPDAAASQPGAGTVFSAFAADSDYFAPSQAGYMVNFMVDDLDGILARAAAEGVEPIKVMRDEFNGHFAHIIDLEGRKIELWEPKA